MAMKDAMKDRIASSHWTTGHCLLKVDTIIEKKAIGKGIEFLKKNINNLTTKRGESKY